MDDEFFFYSYKKFTTSFTFYYTYLATIQYYRDDAKGSEGQRLPQSLNIKTRNYTLHTTNCTRHTVKGQRIVYLILFHIGCQIGVGKKLKKSHECRLFMGSSWIKSDIQYEAGFTKEKEITFTQRNLVVALYIA